MQGLRDKLDYLQNLGVTAVYLNSVFESPSNHKYDTTDFSIIDDNFGDQQTFISLTTELDNRGMHLILDGVFNHTSSDSIYFDRYSRYPQAGACESQTSPYRTWYYFKDVTSRRVQARASAPPARHRVPRMKVGSATTACPNCAPPIPPCAP